MTVIEKPISILVASLGGEGGGVLTDWIAEAARASGLRIQCTSIPGVAQRTGATNYYIEVVPPQGNRVLALTPMPGMVDLVVASELIEAARAVQQGYVTPDRTMMVASTHRVYATSEKSAMGDGRFDETRALKAVTSLAKQAILFDMEETMQEARSAISAVMLGGVAASGVLPIPREIFEQVITASGIAVKSNLSGFDLAYERAGGSACFNVSESPARRKPPQAKNQSTDELVYWALRRFPVETHYFIEQGIRRLTDYQNIDYARLFLERLEPLLELEGRLDGKKHGYKLLCESGRHLALRMSFEDLIRVADLKTRKTRIDRVRAEVDAKANEPVVITEYFKPGLEEVCGFLLPAIARPILRWAERGGKLESFNVGVYLRTTSIIGFTALWVTARLRRLRPYGHRFASEQANIIGWLRTIQNCSRISYGFGLEMVATARLIKGYSGTYRRGLGNFERLMETIVYPAIERNEDAKVALHDAVEAALTHSGATIETPPQGFKPIAFVRNSAKPDSTAASKPTAHEAAAITAGFF